MDIINFYEIKKMDYFELIPEEIINIICLYLGPIDNINRRAYGAR